MLSVITSEHIFVRFPDNPEGELTRMRAELVCEKALAVYAGEIGLGHYLLLGNGEEKGGGRVDDMMDEILRQWHGADYKTLLQQLVQRSEGEVLEYVTVGATGPDHDKVFSVEARLNSNRTPT